jgi:Rod binding domain-containing protein
MSSPISAADLPLSNGPQQDARPKSVAEAAKQFEALMIGQMLKESHGDDEEGGWLGSGGDSGSSMAAGLAEQQFAQALANSGGLGLSARIAADLNQESQTGPPPKHPVSGRVPGAATE